jgi:predicted RNase H-like HicB family nuclease
MAKIMKFKAQVPVTILKEDKVFIAYSPVLDLSTSGKTFSQVRRRFSEAVQIFFEELNQAGTLDEVLTDLGWTKINSQLTPPVSVTNDLIDVCVPAVN